MSFNILDTFGSCSLCALVCLIKKKKNKTKIRTALRTASRVGWARCWLSIAIYATIYVSIFARARSITKDILFKVGVCMCVSQSLLKPNAFLFKVWSFLFFFSCVKIAVHIWDVDEIRTLDSHGCLLLVARWLHVHSTLNAENVHNTTSYVCCNRNRNRFEYVQIAVRLVLSPCVAHSIASHSPLISKSIKTKPKLDHCCCLFVDWRAFAHTVIGGGAKSRFAHFTHQNAVEIENESQVQYWISR